MTPLQALFIVEYLKDLNATQAAIRAGYSKESAAEIGSQNLAKPHIKKEVDRQLQSRATRTLITGDKILHEIFQIADCDPLDAFEANGDLKPLNEIPSQVRKAIASVEIEAMYEMDYEEKGNPKKVEVGLLKKIKFWSKDRAQENLAKHLRLLAERFEVGTFDINNFKFPGITEVFVSSPEALKDLLAQAKAQAESQEPQETAVAPVEVQAPSETTPQPNEPTSDQPK